MQEANEVQGHAVEKRYRRAYRRAAVCVAVLVLAVAGLVVAGNRDVFSPLPKRFASVEEGVLYRSGQPTRRQLANVMEEPGIRTVLIVRERGGSRVEDEIEFAREHDMNVVHLPIESRSPITRDQVEALFACVDDPRNQPVLLHCAGGRHRTGYLSALYRIERQGWSVEAAVEEMLEMGFKVDRHPLLLDQLFGYKRHRQGDAPAQQPRKAEQVALSCS
jgi:protein tyrosine/serine phosphatase